MNYSSLLRYALLKLECLTLPLDQLLITSAVLAFGGVSSRACLICVYITLLLFKTTDDENYES